MKPKQSLSLESPPTLPLEESQASAMNAGVGVRRRQITRESDLQDPIRIAHRTRKTNSLNCGKTFSFAQESVDRSSSATSLTPSSSVGREALLWRRRKAQIFAQEVSRLTEPRRFAKNCTSSQFTRVRGRFDEYRPNPPR